MGMPITEVTHEDFQKILTAYLVDRPPLESGQRLIESFNSLLKWATEKEFRPGPYANFKLPKRKPRVTDPLKMENLQAIVSASDRLQGSDITSAIAIRALAQLGLGVKEAEHFSLGKVDFTRWEYVLEDTRGRLRLTPIPMNMRALLAKARHLQPNGDAHGSDGSAWIAGPLLRAFVRQAGLEVGIQGLTSIQLTDACRYG